MNLRLKPTSECDGHIKRFSLSRSYKGRKVQQRTSCCKSMHEYELYSILVSYPTAADVSPSCCIFKMGRVETPDARKSYKWLEHENILPRASVTIITILNLEYIALFKEKKKTGSYTKTLLKHK